jgi:membrane-associated PAP2 superfamily phosphatase
VTPAATARARRDAAVTLAALALIVAWEASGWDLAVAGWFGGPGGFPARDAWWARSLLHEGGRMLAWAGLLAFAWYAARPGGSGPTRRQRLYWLGVSIACAVAVPALKSISRTSCPWDLASFGGRWPFVPHWLPGVADGGPGHCFPSGHAVGAFAFLGLYFMWRPHRPRAARVALAGVLSAGLIFGWTQLVRGAHFPSHTMWSAWLCWTLCCAAAAWPGVQSAPVPAGRPGAACET